MAQCSPLVPGSAEMFWVGPRMKQVMASGENSCSKAQNWFFAAVADADEYTQNGENEKASCSYKFALETAKQHRLLDSERLLDLMCHYMDSLLSLRKCSDAIQLAREALTLKPDFAKGYMYMSRALTGENKILQAAAHLLEGMKMCSLTNDDMVDFISVASNILGRIKLDMENGWGSTFPLDEQFVLMNMRQQPMPSLPKTTVVWTRVLTRLMKEKNFIAFAYLTVGFNFEQFSDNLCCLDSACPFEVDCSAGSVDDVYSTLDPQKLLCWGEVVAMYMLDHGAAIGNRTKDPLGVYLVKLTFEHKSAALLRHIVTKQIDISPDEVDANGDTALHIVVKQHPVNIVQAELMMMLLDYGALPNIRDKAGKQPHQYIADSFHNTKEYRRMVSALEEPEKSFRERVNRLKQEGNQAHRTKNSNNARKAYQQAINAIERSPYKMPRDLAILYNNMAAVHTSINENDKACQMAARSVTIDPTFHKPYWRLGKNLIDRKNIEGACNKFLEGLSCQETDQDQKISFIREICTLVQSLPAENADTVVSQLMSHLTPVWPRVVETLSKSKSWDAIRCLVLGPPHKNLDPSTMPSGWKFADRYNEGKPVKVGYALTLKANTPVLSTLADAFENRQLIAAQQWVTDLVLALLLQGAQLENLTVGDEETCYHMAAYLCCETENLGLMRYILSSEPHAKKATGALNRKKRTLLHSVCLQCCQGTSQVGQQLVRLLLDKGVNPSVMDTMNHQAAYYVAPNSPISDLLLNLAAPKTAEEMKELGNSEFKKGNFTKAIEYYSQAITFVLNKLPSGVHLSKGYENKKHELAVLFSNRAECHLKLGNIKQAYTDARDSVGYDGHWYRGHVRLGRALLGKGRPPAAIEAFSKAFNSLGSNATRLQKKDVLKELVKAIIVHMVEQPKTIPNLDYVTSDLWAMVAYDYYCAGIAHAESQGSTATNVDWDAGEYAYQQFLKSQSAYNDFPKLDVNLKPLCSWQVTEKHVKPIVDLINFFLVCGCDHTTLSFYEGDTYVHAAAIWTFVNADSALLNWLMTFKIKPRHEENLQDLHGNTALHLCAMKTLSCIPPSPLPVTLRRDLSQILLNWGLDPTVTNKQGRMPIECLEKGDHEILASMKKFMKKAKVPPTRAQQPKAKAQTAPPAEKQKPVPTNQPPKSATTQGFSSNNTSSQSATQGTSNRRGDNSSQRLPCHSCEEAIAEAREYFSKDEKTELAYSNLVTLLSYKHSKDSRHEKFVQKAIELIVDQLEKSLTPDVPDILLKVSQGHLQRILQKLASQDCWRQLDVVVSKARANDVPRGDFAKNVSILALVRNKSLCAAEPQRLQILNMLVTHGGELHKTQTKEMMELAIRHGEIRIVERLIELGVDPHFVSIDKGDTPLHAALSVALDKTKGNNFSLLDQLVALYEEKPEEYSYLDFARVDKDGNTLLHLASRANYSKHSHKAVELLMSKGVPVNVKNHDGKMAIDYLGSSDRRTQYLRMAGKQSVMKKNDAARQKPSTPELATEDGGTGEGNKSLPEDRGDFKTSQPVEKSEADQHNLKTKDAMGILNRLVRDLSDLTSAEVKLAKSSKGKWLEIKKLTRKESISDSEDEEEGGRPEAGATVDPQEVDVEEEEEEDEEGPEEEKREEAEELDPLIFDNLEWEVECTAEVWKTLRDPKVTDSLKQRIVHSIKFLASGEWRPQLCRKVRRVPDTINLYQAKFVKGACILWELAIAFSPRLSEGAEKRINESDWQDDFAVRGGRMYTEIIRVWDIVFRYKVRPAVQRIIQSHERGEMCLLHKELKGVKSQQFQGSLSKRYPMLYSEAEMSKEVQSAMQRQMEEGKLRLYPPASSSQTEFHILKFYCFSSALVYNVLKNLEMKIDFPFRVTDREHVVINLQPSAPILLLGRSGTGKTTCCLYRLWSRFLTYWTKAKEMEYAPWLPRTVQYAVQDDADPTEEDDPNADLFEGLLDGAGPEEMKGATAAAPHQSAKASYGQEPFPGPIHWEEEYEEEESEEVSLESGVLYDHLHQLFVTKNQVLCSEVQKNFRELCHANDVAYHHVELETAAMPHRLQDVDHYRFPLFLTSRQLILMLDASLPPPYFFERNDDGSLKVIIQGWGADEEIFAFVPLEDDSDEEQEENYYDDDDKGEGRGADDGGAAEHRPRKTDNRREVTYEVFAHEIWPKISKKSRVTYHPSLVWTEIISFIKGSFLSLAQPKGYLDKLGYEQLGRKQAPNFSGNREKVYEMFLKYNDYKRQHGLYDEADLVFNIYQRLKTAGPLPWVLHEVFVDETQDFTQAELTVLIRLAHNPNEMFLAGDTAQSIMRGVSFRFSDLKTLFHYAKQSLKARGKTGMLEIPRHVYQLTHNYRSHAGILSLASSVLDLLVEFFPESFDRLQKDQGLFDGPQPVLLESGSPADLAILLSGNKRKTSHIEFGAHQVILVVNDEARNNLPEELSLGLVLTIYEAKGLEFDDVLLYNFFKDSEASKEWRVVTDYLERLSKNDTTITTNTSGLVEIDEDLLQQTGRPRPLTFDPNQHKILNSELKHLYTAVTRARVNVWIFDQDASKRAPMFEYFKARKLVKFVSMADGGEAEGVSQSMFAETSSPAEWEKRGDEIMMRSLYDVAAKCYAMAKATHKESIAIAHQRALKASQLRSQPRQMRDAFLNAAILFLDCHQTLVLSSETLALRFNLVMKAGRCLQNARENYLAAMVFEKNGQLELAGPLYLRAREWVAASQCFEHVDNFGRAVKILDEHELYDQAIDCLQRYKIRKQDLEKKGMPLTKALQDHKPDDSLTVDSLSYKAAELYHRYGENRRMLAAIERLSNKEDQVSFLQKKGYLTEAAEKLREDGHFTDAARIMLHNGQVDKAIRIAEEGDEESLKAQCYMLKAKQLMATQSKKSSKAKASADKSAVDPAAVEQVCQISGRSEEEETEALLEAIGDVDTAVDILSKRGEKKSRQKSSTKASKKKNSDAVSSEEEDDDSDEDKDTQKERGEKKSRQKSSTKASKKKNSDAVSSEEEDDDSDEDKDTQKERGEKKSRQKSSTKASKKKNSDAVSSEEEDDDSDEDKDTQKERGEKKSRQKSSTKASKKKNSDAVSSEEEDDDSDEDKDTQKEVVASLEQARQHFDLCKDFSGLGECQLILAELRKDVELLERAHVNFSTAQPVSNFAGMLECVEALCKLSGSDLDLSNSGKLIWGVERVFDVVRVLLRPITPEDKNRHDTYLAFYGLEKADQGKLLLHPRLKPRCLRMIGSKNLFASKEEKREEKLYKSDTEVCNLLARYLICRTNKWCEDVEFHLSIILPKVNQCCIFREGLDCEDLCPYLHDNYTEILTEEAISALSSQVRQDHALQSGAETLEKIDETLSKLTMSLAQQEKQWNSVETLLEFILPPGLLTYNMSSVINFCISVSRKSPLNGGVHNQVKRYLQYLWDNPGRVGKGKSTNVLKERSKSTNWIVLASLLVPLFKLDIKVAESCQNLEYELGKKKPKWADKRSKYAVVKEGNVFMSVARRHLDALDFLQPNKFDPFESLIKFTKFIKLLHDRREVSLMPDLQVFLFWLEYFSTLGLCLAAKIRGNGVLLLPYCYSRLLRLYNLTLPQAKRGYLMKLLEDFRPARSQTLKLLHDRIKYLVFLLCDTRPKSFCLLTHLSQEKKDKSSTSLLMERTLILALTLLINVEQDNVPTICETSVMRCVQAIPESKVQDMPPRLASLIDGVQDASTYQHVIDALSRALHQVKERVQFYQWRWSKRELDALMPIGLSNQKAGGVFWEFKPEIPGASVMGFVPDGDGEDIDEDVQVAAEEEGEEEEEEEMSPEERERCQQQTEQTQKEERQKEAVPKLVSFLRSIIFRKRMRGLKRHCLLQIGRELFSSYTITSTMCGVCGVSFEVAAPATKQDSSEVTEEADAKEDGEDEQSVLDRCKQEHLNSPEHRQQDANFGIFRQVYYSVLAIPIHEIGIFLSKHEVKKQRDKWYRDLPFQVEVVTEKLETLKQQLFHAIKERKWMDRAVLIHHKNDLNRFFQEHVRYNVERRYAHHQDLQKRKSADRAAEQDHQEKMKDGMVEDAQDLEVVVDQPFHTGPNANPPYYHRGRGGGHGWDRGNPRGWHRGQPYQGHAEDQFGQGDLPPRFQRNH